MQFDLKKRRKIASLCREMVRVEWRDFCDSTKKTRAMSKRRVINFRVFKSESGGEFVDVGNVEFDRLIVPINSRVIQLESWELIKFTERADRASDFYSILPFLSRFLSILIFAIARLSRIAFSNINQKALASIFRWDKFSTYKMKNIYRRIHKSLNERREKSIREMRDEFH